MAELELAVNRPSLNHENIGEPPIFSNDQRPVVSYQVGGRSLRKTTERDKHFAAEKKFKSSTKRWVSSL